MLPTAKETTLYGVDPDYYAPGAPATHAEQQVLNWLEWIETHGPYARSQLSGIYSPKAFIIIGRKKGAPDVQSEKLRRRNLVYRDQIEILTYDDLLERAQKIQSRLISVR